MVRGPGTAMTRPLLWSAAGHLLVLSACLLVGAGRGPADRLLPVVEVLLVGGEPGPAVPLGGEDSPSPTSTDGRVPRRPWTDEWRGSQDGGSARARDAQERSRAEERPRGAAPTPQESAAPAARGTWTADPAARPAEPPASVPAAGIPGGPAAPGSAAGAAPSFPGIDPVATGTSAGSAGRAPNGPAPVLAGRGAGSGGSGGGDGRSRSIGDIGLLRERIQSGIVYPEEAVRRGLEGEVVLRVHIATGGVPNDIRVARSSGARLLDDAARRGVVRAAPLPSTPGWVDVPVRFRLR